MASWQEAMQHQESPATVVRGDENITHCIMQDYPEGYELMKFPGVNLDGLTEEQVNGLLNAAGLNDDGWRAYRGGNEHDRTNL